MQHLLGALLEDEGGRAHAREDQDEGDQHGGREMKHDDPRKQDRRSDERRQRRGRVRKPCLVPEELQLIAHRRRGGGPVFADEIALQTLRRRQLQSVEEGQGAVGHVQMGFGDRHPQATGALQIGAADQGAR